MFKSIRWRLIISYILLTLLTVAVVGSVTYQIIDHYVQQRKSASLRSNAEALAKQAYPYLWPVLQREELTRTRENSCFPW